MTAHLTNKAYGFPTRGAKRRVNAPILACIHITGNRRTAAKRANAILRPPITTVTVKAGDSLSGIASAHKRTLKALLAFPENAKYRARPGLVHPGAIVRVK